MVQPFKKPNFFSRRIAFGATVGSAVVFFLVGVFFWAGFNTAMEATNTTPFCISCHEMETTVYQEYVPTIHYSNRTGVRAGCPDCHVPRPWIAKMIRKVQASGEVYHKILGTVDTPEKFEGKRLLLAKRVWKSMKETDSRECRNCHNFESMNPEFQSPRARKQHLNAFETGQTCIDCHKGIAHNDVRKLLTDEELEALEAPDPEMIREVPQMFLDGLAAVEKIEAEEKAEKQAAKDKARAAKKAAKEAEKVRIEEAVAAALAAYKAQAAGGAVATTAAASDVGVAGPDWDDVPAREISIFYPGQTSMEWTLSGKDHGGARAFIKGGDRCFDCHDNEIMDMGPRIVGGEHEKAQEPTVIPGKRGAFPVQVQAAHDGENLYLRFQWEASEHTPAPFVDGGKMDPENPVKFAVMLATDDVEYAAQAGCWGTCHHDMNGMPHLPEGQKVTKYLAESRTGIEIKGKRGKKRGGWDKRKPDADIQAELGAGHFIDILRVNSGTGQTEDGYILADRVMEGGQGLSASATLDGDTWTVVMQRKLASDKPGDLSLALDKVYNLGFAVHDDYTDGRYHHVSVGYKLGFDNAETEVNAVKRDVKAAPAAAAPAAAASQASGGGAEVAANVDWSKASDREISIFYPGQTSMEWTLSGKDHGGARAFIKGGDRCFDCHDNEIMDMGPRIVGGEHEKAQEPTVIPGKRGSFPVQVQSTHDKENLYLRFQWEASEHTPAPFVDGGKMDADNPVKLSVMLATDDVEYAAQSGCWGTCHHDMNGMPHLPEGQKVTKYIAESRTGIEVKGKRGKKRGGWDKRKPDADIQDGLAAGHFIDILRVKSSTGETEDGHILADRVMEGGQGLAASAALDGDTWTVVMQRKLTSDKLGDLSLALDKVYNLGFAIHDDHTNGRYHHVSVGYKLGFDNAETEVNATAQ
ncbi:Cytochrome c-type protein NapC [hydrothermal vent metagenome]|uniref:Cytochrome c-type protein NapC n=1 Tax=hydrothermal vent metagenome TaxID=652676 RepID=A0A3B1B726_9ZZZZ